MAQNCPNLKVLDLSATTLVDSCLMEIAKHCTQLEKLLLASNYITDYSIIEIARNCTNLLVLNICACSHIGDAIVEIAKHCTQLRYLNISRTKATYASINAIAENLLNLRTLDCVIYWEIPHATIYKLLNNCEHLETLSCGTSVHEIRTDIIKKFPQLQRINNVPVDVYKKGKIENIFKNILK